MEVKPTMFFIAVTSLLVGNSLGAHSDRVLLRDISALTLRHGMQTNARRSGAVPQLKCLGGSAGCTAFVPQVVQCQNRGFDGYDVQWECKTDMDNAYRFGQVEVTCEGYDYPEDPYVLRGSCGLEYTLDYTKEGSQQQKQQHQYYGHDEDYHDHSSNYYNSYKHKKSGSGVGGLLGLAAAAFVIYYIYKNCLASGTPPDSARPMPDDPPPYSPHDSGNQAPPPGFKPEFTPGHSGAGYSGGFTNPGGCNNGGYTNTGYANTGYTNTSTGTGGGFWTGMATGGLMGYLFGNSGNSGYNNGYYGPTHHRHRPYGSSWGSSWFGGSGTGGSGWFGGSGTGSSYRSRPSFGGSSFGGSSSSGTRTASGFGGTKRR